MNDTYRLTLGSPAVWSKYAPPASPIPRAGHRAIFDPPRNRIVTFGGVGNVIYLGDPWEFLLTNADWNFLSYSSLVPRARAFYAMVHDPIRQRAILIGGYDGSVFLDDVWALALTGRPDWTPLATGPGGRLAHSVVYQPGRDRVILFGGLGGAIHNDVLALSLSGTPAWQAIVPSGPLPPPRFAHVAVYDAARDRMVIFGGYDGTGSRNDTWALSLGSSPAWSRLSPSGPLPEVRNSSGGVYDATSDRLVVFGGFNATDQRFLNDVWALPLGTTTPVAVSVMSTRAEPGVVRISWHVTERAGTRVAVHRRGEPGSWQTVAEPFADGMGRVKFEDREVTGGARYGYRLAFREGDRETVAGEVWLDVPRAAGFSLAGARPNPATRGVTIAFSLQDDGPATIELVDAAGRVVIRREFSTLGAGEHEVRLDGTERLPSGLYLARLRQEERRAVRKVLVAR